ncbi:MAG: hypothetical protein UW25_C0004G0003 [Candidatus Nomurabacteria bacterium GW2011_GWB1_44_12]|uniref:Uncharacterized protein n=1 Tax=Candidatus Nomurabacteria bacterium GW2011_GWB1_44_12 TaxID=1618748 RepID=A0A837IBB3_9BACT|nr:MAG: hypothetical protein UW25_C0004G0003 [Candidatus Nomurabacteria bacterium GW2011_GWB1_44_12]
MACQTAEILYPDTAFGVATAQSRADKRGSDDPFCRLPGVVAYETTSSEACKYIVMFCNQFFLPKKNLRLS